MFPFPSGSSSACVQEQVWERCLPSSSDWTHTWFGARWWFYFSLLTSLCLSTLLGKILKGIDPGLGSSLEALHAARCYTFLGIFAYIWLLALSFPFSSYTWMVEGNSGLSAGKQSLFSFKITLNQASWQRSFSGSFTSRLGLGSWCPAGPGLPSWATADLPRHVGGCGEQALRY